MRRGADLSRSIDYHVFAGAEFISTEIFEVFAERIFELTKAGKRIVVGERHMVDLLFSKLLRGCNLICL